MYQTKLNFCRTIKKRSNFFLAGIFTLATLLATPSFASDKSSYPTYQAAKQKSDSQPIQPDASTPELWSHIVKTFSLPHYANTPEVQEQIRFYENHKEDFNNIITNASPYLYFIYRQVKRNNLPGELVLLPVIESAYDPFAYSHAGAAGLWQMMPATGSSFGLKRDYWYDGRRDITSSTHAALTYLAYLDNFFDDNWLLAIAAYNSGEGTVSHAFRRNENLHQSTEFWSLALPNETESYVPRLLAVAEIIAHPDKYGFTLPRIPNKPYFVEMEINNSMELSQVAQLSDMNVNDIYALNPGYSHWKTDPKLPTKILLPIDKASLFQANAGHESSTTVTVKPVAGTGSAAFLKGAGKHKTTTKASQNTSAPQQTTVKTPTPSSAPAESATTPPQTTGKTPTPSAASTKDTSTASATSTTTKTKQPAYGHYTVKKGDTLSKIARSYHTTEKQLEQINHLRSAKIRAGQKILVPPKQ